ncbi:hypothetical protein KKE60_04880 [Patescibacteria group bacterium]|nr:hypothetical protein [Patescibacteria group bacterium]
MSIAAITPSTQGTTTGAVSIGHRYEDAFGRTFFYAYCTTAIGRGKLAAGAAAVANHNNLSFQTAPAVGDMSVKVTLGGTAATAEQYKDGWLVVNDGTGEGRLYPIEGHSAQTSTTGTLEVFLKEAIDTAGALSESNVDLVYNRYDELLVQSSTTQTYIPAGVPIMVGGLGAAEYGYIQTWGPCAVWADEANDAVGTSITFGAGTGTGQYECVDAATEPFLGVTGPTTVVATEYPLVYLMIDR